MSSINYTNMMWGPYVSRMQVEEHIVKKLLEDGEILKENKRKNNFNPSLAGNLENQFKYNQDTENFFWEEMVPYLKCYRHGHCEFHQIKYFDVKFKSDSLWVNFMKAGESLRQPKWVSFNKAIFITSFSFWLFSFFQVLLQAYSF